MMLWVMIVLTIALVIWFAGAWYVRGPDLGLFDNVKGAQPPTNRQRFSTGTTPNAEHHAVVASLGDLTTALKGTPRRKHLKLLRDYMDNMFAHRRFDAQFIPVDAGGVSAEWVLAPGADGSRRTLYIHGGACHRRPAPAPIRPKRRPHQQE